MQNAGFLTTRLICRHAFRTDFACKINFKSDFPESGQLRKIILLHLKKNAKNVSRLCLNVTKCCHSGGVVMDGVKLDSDYTAIYGNNSTVFEQCLSSFSLLY